MATRDEVQLQVLNDETFLANDKFQIGPMKLVQLVQLSDKREFCEEVDELENLYKKS